MMSADSVEPPVPDGIKPRSGVTGPATGGMRPRTDAMWPPRDRKRMRPQRHPQTHWSVQLLPAGKPPRTGPGPWKIARLGQPNAVRLNMIGVMRWRIVVPVLANEPKRDLTGTTRSPIAGRRRASEGPRAWMV